LKVANRTSAVRSRVPTGAATALPATSTSGTASAAKASKWRNFTSSLPCSADPSCLSDRCVKVNGRRRSDRALPAGVCSRKRSGRWIWPGRGRKPSAGTLESKRKVGVESVSKLGAVALNCPPDSAPAPISRKPGRPRKRRPPTPPRKRAATAEREQPHAWKRTRARASRKLPATCETATRQRCCAPASLLPL
jgi:hypothetical protein